MRPAPYQGDNRREWYMDLDIYILQNLNVDVRRRAWPRHDTDFGVDGCTQGCVKLTFLEERVGREEPGAKRTYLLAY